MTVTTFSFDLAIRDSETVLGSKEVFILPKNHDQPRRLSNAEARHALAFLGMVPSHAVVTVQKAPSPVYTHRDEAGLLRSLRAQTIVRALFEIGDFIAPKDLHRKVAPVPKGTVSSVLADLLRYDFVDRQDVPIAYCLSGKGLEFFADIIAPKQAKML